MQQLVAVGRRWSLPWTQWTEAGPRDHKSQVGVWVLLVHEVELSLSDMNHLGLFHCQRANAAVNFHGQLVLHWEHLDHHSLYTWKTWQISLCHVRSTTRTQKNRNVRNPRNTVIFIQERNCKEDLETSVSIWRRW